jgi:hypothetical protein
MADKKEFSNTKSTVKVETGIVTLISYHHYLKIVGNNKLWPDMQKESWNIHLSLRALLPYVEWNPIRNPRWEQKQTEGYVIVSNDIYAIYTKLTTKITIWINWLWRPQYWNTSIVHNTVIKIVYQYCDLVIR